MCTAQPSSRRTDRQRPEYKFGKLPWRGRLRHKRRQDPLFHGAVEQHQHRKIACLEEIAYLNGWISKDELMEVYEVMKKNQYGQYLKDVMDGKYQEHLY